MFLQVLVRFNLIVFQISGICPCDYDVTNRRWKSSQLIRIYSILVYIFQVIAIIVVVYVVSEDISKSNRSKTMFYASQLTCAIVISTLVAVYTFQLKNVHLFVEYANDLKMIYEQIERYCHQSDHWSLLVIVVKLTLTVLINCIVTIIEIKNLSSTSSVFGDEILYKILYFCPNFVLLMLPSMFYCLVLFLEHTLKQLNAILLEIVADSAQQNDDTMLQQSCDRIESISLIFSSLHKSTVKLNKVFDVQLLASNCCSVSMLVVKLYLIFLMMASISSSNYISVIMASLKSLLNQFFYMSGTYLVAESSSNISKKVTGCPHFSHKNKKKF